MGNVAVLSVRCNKLEKKQMLFVEGKVNLLQQTLHCKKKDIYIYTCPIRQIQKKITSPNKPLTTTMEESTEALGGRVSAQAS